jgi:DNA ligase-1
VQPFQALQRRIGRKSVGRKLLAEVPARFLAFDIIEWEGRDQRAVPLVERRALLERVIGALGEEAAVGVSPRIDVASWDEAAGWRARSRDHRAEGLMLKRADSPYAVGRPTGLWWKWKIAPFSCDAVLIHAQRGHGRRASLYTDYTFAVWAGEKLVPFAKAYSELTDAEIRQVDQFVRQHTIERFGPVRSVEPRLVFELAFEGIQLSTRHKCGVAVRFPRILRQRLDKTPEQADTLDRIKALLGAQAGGVVSAPAADEVVEG